MTGFCFRRRWISVQQLVGRDAERARQPRAAAEDVADQFLLLRPGGAEQHGLAVAVEAPRRRRRDRSAVRGCRVRPARGLDETAQAETVEIRDRGLRVEIRLFKNAHLVLPRRV